MVALEALMEEGQAEEEESLPQHPMQLVEAREVGEDIQRSRVGHMAGIRQMG